MTGRPFPSQPASPARSAQSVEAELRNHRVLPIVTIDDPAAALASIDALTSGGLPCAEITLRTPGALAALSEIAMHRCVLIGAGTVISVPDADLAMDAGAQFLVSPGVSEPVIRRCAERGVLIIPGVVTPTDVMQCLSLGVTLMKLFPAAAAGGAALLDALSAPFPRVRFLPTGGINLTTAKDYLARPSVVAVGGSWMIPRGDLAACRFDVVTALTAETVRVLGSGAPEFRSAR